MSITPTDITKVAHLARIRIDAREIDEVTARINNILALVDQMQAVDTAAIEPIANPLDATQRLRADEVTEIDQRERFLGIAPATEGGLFLVPKVIE